MLEYTFVIIGAVFALEFIFYLLWDNYDEIYKLKNKNLVEIRKGKAFIIKHIRLKRYFNRDYEKWALSRKEFNKIHVAKPVLVGQILLHIFCLYLIIAGIIFIIISNKTCFINFIIYPSCALGIINIILSIISSIIVDININKIFPRDNIKRNND